MIECSEVVVYRLLLGTLGWSLGKIRETKVFWIKVQTVAFLNNVVVYALETLMFFAQLSFILLPVFRCCPSMFLGLVVVYLDLLLEIDQLRC